jgi:hypothetical protein
MKYGLQDIDLLYGSTLVKDAIYNGDIVYQSLPLQITEADKSLVFVAGVDFLPQNGRFRIPWCEITNNDVLICGTDVRRNTFGDYTITDLGIKRSTDWGATWLTEQIVHENNNIDTEGTGSRKHNGTILKDPRNNRIYIFARTVDNYTDQSTSGVVLNDFLWDCVYKYSDDDGATWSAEISLSHLLEPTGSNSFFGGTSNKGILMSSGTLVVPIYEQRHSSNRVETGTDWQLRSGFIYSSDGGTTWQKSSLIPAPTGECSVVEFPAGRINIFCRTFTQSRRHFYTDDMGLTWQVGGLDKKNNGFICQIGTHKIDDTLIWHSSMSSTERANLQMFISKDFQNYTLFIDNIFPGAYYGYSCSCSKDDKFFLIYEIFTGTTLVNLSRFLNYI